MSDPIRTLIARLFLAALVASCLVASPSARPSTAQDASIELAAVIMHSDDLDWIVDQQELQGQLDNAPHITDVSLRFTTVEEVIASPYYARGRGGFLPAESDTVDLADLLDESEWVQTVDAFMVRQSSMEGSWINGIGVSIEEYESPDGAALAFEAFNDPDPLAEVAQASDIEELDAPRLGDEAAMWSFQSDHWGSPSIPVITLWVLVDTYIVSISGVDASEITEPDPAVIERLMEFQLTRLEHAEHLYQPSLSTCAPRLAGDDVVTLNDDYVQLNGKAFGVWFDTYATMEETEALAADHGMVDRYRVRQRISGTEVGATDGLLYYTVVTRTFEDDDSAAAYIDDLEQVLEEEGREELSELDDVPTLGDAARTFTYVGGSGSLSTVTYVLVENVVFSVFLGPSNEPLADLTYDFADAYIERLDDGDCDEPLAVPRGV